MCIRFILVIRSVFLFCVLGVFLLSADFKVYSDPDGFFYKKYTCEFDSGSIASISFKKEEMTDVYKKKLAKSKDDKYVNAFAAGFPNYTLSFVIVGEHRGVNIKEVIFDGVEAKPSIFHLGKKSDLRFKDIKDFHIGLPDSNAKFIELVFPVPVHNVFNITLRKRFVDKLKAQDKLKITLISTYGKEFVLETENFIRKYDF
ncbi:hypothetical protein bcCo53_001205 (plasmid) [Borrelia coriaceae]|uniref:hypothetical protein n=1 Tax=Borrelia coriaceae TaxID=144 RepID=UPI00046C96D4|nr:hypothetical protein [Borrelia coriaceae]UPA17036.1 hypothetical protein bcCo53_001205 [Borrelia coriaceae]